MIVDIVVGTVYGFLALITISVMLIAGYLKRIVDKDIKIERIEITPNINFKVDLEPEQIQELIDSNKSNLHNNLPGAWCESITSNK